MQFEVISPLGSEDFLLHTLSCRETLCQISEMRLECLSLKTDIDPDAVLGKMCSIRITLEDESERFLSAYFTHFSHTGTVGRHQRYAATLHPWPWFMTRTTDCRIFQNKTVPEIIKEVFADHSVAEFRDALTGSYAPQEYCVQYRETDYNFVARLMEEEGIYFFFEYEKDKNVLVLADSYSAHSPVPGQSSFQFIDNVADAEADYITHWRFGRSVQPGKTRLIDYDFKRPRVKLDAKAIRPRSNEQSEHEVFDYPGEFVEQANGEHLARTRLDEFQAQYETAHAHSNARALGCGMLFTLSDHVRNEQNTEYLVTGTNIDIINEGSEAGQSGDGSRYLCSFSALNSKQDFRPPRITPRPFVRGIQTAVVVGPPGDEIHTDKYSRIKVQFHWDRLGQNDADSSCWIRVAQPWAGQNWGFITIPRIGQEVVVEFLEGDPDRPLIIGSVYNADKMPPYELPANMTQSGIKTRSSKGGTPENCNEIRFEDKKGQEQVYIHAEKDQSISVENDESHTVGHDRSKTVDNDETVHIKHDRKETVDHDETITIGNNRTETVGVDETVSIGGNRVVSITGNDQLDVTGSIKQTAMGEIVITSNTKITLNVMGSTVEISPSGITASFGASSITIDAAGVAVAGPKISLNG